MHKPDARVYADTKSWLVPNYFVVGIVNPAGALHRSRKGSGSPGFSVVAKCNAAPIGPVWVTKLNREVGLRSRPRGGTSRP